jgi:peptidyl-prolyl cis-trans isomerase A (cyclophilin A)
VLRSNPNNFAVWSQHNPACAERVRLVTRFGSMVIEVSTDRAPQSAGAFLRYADSGKFARASFVRSVRPENDRGNPKITVIQAAVPDSDRLELIVEHESTATTGIAHVNGAVSLGRKELGSGSPAAFFICLGEQPSLNHGGQRAPDGQGFAAFGQVITGMEVAWRMHAEPTLIDAPDPYLTGQIFIAPIAILSVEREIIRRSL